MSKKLLGVHEVPKGSELRIGSVNGSGAAKYYKFVVSTIDDNKEMTLPALAGDDVFVFEGQSQTLTNKTLTSAVLNGSISGTSIKDEDNMASNSASHLATQQSIKAYVDAQLTAQDLDFQGDSGGALSIDLDSEVLDIAGGTGLSTVGSENTLTVSLDDTSVTAAEYGDAASAVTFTVDAQGRLTAASEAAISITASQVSDFSEAVDDRASALCQAGEGIDITYDDAAGSLTFAAELASASNPGVASFASADFDVSNAGAVSLKAGSVEFTDLAGAAVQTSGEAFSDSDSILMTSAAIQDKIAADAAAFDLDLAGDSGTAAVLLNSQSLTVAGTSNEIVTAASGQTLTISLPDDVTIGNDLTVTGDVGAVDVTASGALSAASADLGGNMTIEGNITHDAGSGNMAIASSNGEVHVEGTQFNGNNVIIPGTLTVQGATTTVSSNEVNIGDNIIVLNSDETGSPSQSAGIEIERGSAANKQFLWNEASDYWDVGSEQLRSTGGFLGNASTASQLATGREIEFAGGDVEGTIDSFDGSADIANVALTIQSGAVELSMMAANSVDSDQYVDGSIDTVHIADSQITLAKMAANSVDSDQYVDGSIDLAHMSANSVDSDQYVDGSIDKEHLSGTLVNSHTAHTTGADSDELLVSVGSGGTDYSTGFDFMTDYDGGAPSDLYYIKASDASGNTVVVQIYNINENYRQLQVQRNTSHSDHNYNSTLQWSNVTSVQIDIRDGNGFQTYSGFDKDVFNSSYNITTSATFSLYFVTGFSLQGPDPAYSLKKLGLDDLKEYIGTGAVLGGDGITVSESAGVATVAADLKSSGGLKISSAEIMVEPADFAGDGLMDDGSDNMKVKLHEASAGDSGLAVSSDGLKIGSGLVVNAMMAADSVDSDQYVDGSIDLAHHATPSFNGSTAPSGFQLSWTGSAWLHSRPSAMLEFDCSWDSSGDCSLDASQPAWVTFADGLIKIELDHASLFGAYAGQSPYFMAQVFVETSNGIQELAGTNMKIDSTGSNECIASFDLDGAALSASGLKVFIGFVQMGGLVNS